MTLQVLHGDCLDLLPTLDADSIAAVVTDPPYHLTSMVQRLSRTNGAEVEKNFTKTCDGQATNPFAAMARGFMGKSWDGGDIAFRPDTWRAVLRVMKPGAYMVCFASTRGYHRMVCAIEDAGFIIHPMLGWIFGSGFPKATNLSRMIDKHLGATREPGTPRVYADGTTGHWGVSDKFAQDAHTKSLTAGTPKLDTAPATPEAQQWDGWAYGLQSLKPGLEPICLAQKPAIREGMVANVLRHGTGAINVDATRIGTDTITQHGRSGDNFGFTTPEEPGRSWSGRWPANVLHDGSPEVLDAFARFGESTSTDNPRHNGEFKSVAKGRDLPHTTHGHADCGSPARFFASCPPSPDELRFHYSAKADKADRAGSSHPTVKPLSLLKWLTRLITPPGGTVLDPFAGSGGVAEACMLQGFDCILIEREAQHAADIAHRINRWSGADRPLFTEAAD